jgi:hypothetical protein
VVVGSANISARAAQGDSLEVGLVTTLKRVRTQAVEFVDDLTAGRQPVTLAEIEALPNTARNAAPEVAQSSCWVLLPGPCRHITMLPVSVAGNGKRETDTVVIVHQPSVSMLALASAL